jgi:hypothetical protein
VRGASRACLSIAFYARGIVDAVIIRAVSEAIAIVIGEVIGCVLTDFSARDLTSIVAAVLSGRLAFFAGLYNAIATEAAVGEIILALCTEHKAAGESKVLAGVGRGSVAGFIAVDDPIAADSAAWVKVAVRVVAIDLAIEVIVEAICAEGLKAKVTIWILEALIVCAICEAIAVVVKSVGTNLDAKARGVTKAVKVVTVDLSVKVVIGAIVAECFKAWVHCLAISVAGNSIGWVTLLREDNDAITANGERA